MLIGVFLEGTSPTCQSTDSVVKKTLLGTKVHIIKILFQVK
jgi:hypothetical protein